MFFFKKKSIGRFKWSWLFSSFFDWLFFISQRWSFSIQFESFFADTSNLFKKSVAQKNNKKLIKKQNLLVVILFIFKITTNFLLFYLFFPGTLFCSMQVQSITSMEKYFKTPKGSCYEIFRYSESGIVSMDNCDTTFYAFFFDMTNFQKHQKASLAIFIGTVRQRNIPTFFCDTPVYVLPKFSSPTDGQRQLWAVLILH